MKISKILLYISSSLAVALCLSINWVMLSPSTASAADAPVQTYNPDKAVSGGNCSNLNQCDLITKYLNPAIAFFSAFFGVAVVISIIYGGIEYGSSGGDPQKVSAGKKRIRNALFALIAYIFLFALLNFIVPGGLI